MVKKPQAACSWTADPARSAVLRSHGHMALDLGNSGLGIRAQHLPAARRQVTNNIAHGFIRD